MLQNGCGICPGSLVGTVPATIECAGATAHAIPICSTKSMHGHVLGATGAIEVVSVIAAMRGGFIPPTINYQEPDPRRDLDYVPNVAREQRISTAISNNFGFGGNNCTLVLGAALA